MKNEKQKSSRRFFDAAFIFPSCLRRCYDSRNRQSPLFSQHKRHQRYRMDGSWASYYELARVLVEKWCGVFWENLEASPKLSTRSTTSSCFDSFDLFDSFDSQRIIHVTEPSHDWLTHSFAGRNSKFPQDPTRTSNKTFDLFYLLSLLPM